MLDSNRVIDLHMSFASDMRDYLERNISCWHETLRSLQTRFWYEALSQRTGLNTAYELERHFEPSSFTFNDDGTIEYYKNKWTGYRQGQHRPMPPQRELVEKKAPGSTRELLHPLWSALNLNDKRVMRENAFLRQLLPPIQEVMFKPGSSGVLGYTTRAPITQRLLDKLERRAGMDVLACLTWLLREAAEKQCASAQLIGHALHNVLTMMALELHALKIALPLLQIFIDQILPLGLPQHYRTGMTPGDYVNASGYLNRIVYTTTKGRKRKLDWDQRCKIMQQLIQGKSGWSVKYAMMPQYELDDGGEELPADVIEAHSLASKQREWGWDCLLTGKEGRMPPVEVL